LNKSTNNNFSNINIHASAPGKLTLFGEHFVVYGNSAILAAINKRISVTLSPNKSNSINIKFGRRKLAARFSEIKSSKLIPRSQAFLYPVLNSIASAKEELSGLSGLDVLIESQIPHGEGLGSSAAVCVAIVGALQSLVHKEGKANIFEAASQTERLIHKNSSGADCYASTYGGVLLFGPNFGNKQISIKGKLQFLVCMTGIKHKTQNLVSKVKRMKDKNPSKFSELAERANDICFKAKSAMITGDVYSLGNLLTENHKLLQKLQISHPRLEEYIEICMNSGALGCKLTGAGGGGAVIALLPNQNNSDTLLRIQNKIPNSMLAELDYKGVHLDQSLNSEKKF